MNPIMLPVYIVAIVVGIPVISGSVTKIVKTIYADREAERNRNRNYESETIKEMEAVLKDLRKRVENLETILLDLDNRRNQL